MIEVTSSIHEYASAHVASRARNCFVRRLAPDRFIVTPREPDKTRRLVTFRLRPGGRLLARCEDFYTGEMCPANAHGLLCGHCLKAVQHADRLARKEQRLAA